MLGKFFYEQHQNKRLIDWAMPLLITFLMLT